MRATASGKRWRITWRSDSGTQGLRVQDVVAANTQRVELVNGVRVVVMVTQPGEPGRLVAVQAGEFAPIVKTEACTPAGFGPFQQLAIAQKTGRFAGLLLLVHHVLSFDWGEVVVVS